MLFSGAATALARSHWSCTMKAAHFSASLRPRDRFPACHGRVLQAGFERKRGRTAQQRGSALAAIAFSAPSVCPRRDPCKKPAPERLLCPSFSLPLLHFPAFVHSYHLFRLNLPPWCNFCSAIADRSVRPRKVTPPDKEAYGKD